MFKHLAPPLLAAAALLSSCASSTPRQPAADASALGPSMNPRRYATLQKIAAKDLGCPADKLQHEYLGENQHEMRGCDTNGLYELRCMMGSCVWIPDLRSRAEFDLNCPRAQIKVSVIDQTTRGAIGCSKRATYKMSPVDGSWILNSPVSVEQAPVPAPAAAGATAL